MLKPENRFYVYKWVYPDGTVFYVGKGTGTRYKQALWDARRLFPQCMSPIPVSLAIQKAWLVGLDPTCTIVCNHMLERDAFRLEQQLIAEYESDQLVNMARGGQAGTRRRQKDTL